MMLKISDPSSPESYHSFSEPLSDILKLLLFFLKIQPTVQDSKCSINVRQGKKILVFDKTIQHFLHCVGCLCCEQLSWSQTWLTRLVRLRLRIKQTLWPAAPWLLTGELCMAQVLSPATVHSREHHPNHLLWFRTPGSRDQKQCLMIVPSWSMYTG